MNSHLFLNHNIVYHVFAASEAFLSKVTLSRSSKAIVFGLEMKNNRKIEDSSNEQKVSRLERLRQNLIQKKLSEDQMETDNDESVATETDDSTMCDSPPRMFEAMTAGQSSPHPARISHGDDDDCDGPPSPPSPHNNSHKSPFHAMFFNAADAWLQSQQTNKDFEEDEENDGSIQLESTSQYFDGENMDEESSKSSNSSQSSEPANPEKLPPNKATEVCHDEEEDEEDISSEEEDSMDSSSASSEDDSNDGDYEFDIPEPPNTMDDLHQIVAESSTNSSKIDEPNLPTEQTATQQVFENSPSIVSIDSTEEEDGDDDLDNTDADEGESIFSTSGRLTARSSIISSVGGENSIHSDAGSLDRLFQRVQLQNKRTAWATYKSLSSSSTTFSNEEMHNVFIKDDKYSWVPAKVLEFQKGFALVAIDPPSNWQDATILHEETNALLSSDLHLSMKDIPSEDISRLVAEYELPRCQLRKVSYEEYDLEELPLQNPPGEGKRDMADLSELHPASILYNLKDRHYNGKPYTRVGDIIVAMNPFAWFDDLYTTKTRDMYSTHLIWEAHQNEVQDATDFSKRKSVYHGLGFDPHVYETSALAYRDLACTRQDQTILVTGESGAGKTETVKIVMHHLATVQQTRPEGVPSEHSAAKQIVDRVCRSSPVFEAFGNAKTIRNENSSRFGKFIQLIFQLESKASANHFGRTIPFADLVGSQCVTYLLEKNRVVAHADGERTYHIFYQLLAAPKEFKESLWEFFGDMSATDFSFTSSVDTTSTADGDMWEKTKAALELFKFEGEDLKELMKALAIVLQLGNLRFDYDQNNSFEEGSAYVQNRGDLATLSDMSGIEEEILETALTSRVLQTKGHDDIKVDLSPQVAKECCDALTKDMYSKIFDLIVRRINEYTSFSISGGTAYGRISLLDIFGFERFSINRFEQLCINYANERLHHKYVLDNFNAVKDEYESEGVDLYDFSLVDNTAIIDLLEGKTGIIISLNEECVRPKGNAESFVYRLKGAHDSSQILIDQKLHRNCEFGINHFTGPVDYDATNFVGHNMDKLPHGLVDCAIKSTNVIIREEFMSARDRQATGKGSRRKSMAGTHTVLSTFQTQLKTMLAAIEGSRTRYVRCIKPNANMIPRKTSQSTTMQQLECSGLMTALIMTKESFPSKHSYDFLLQRYRCLTDDKELHDSFVMEPKEMVDRMLSKWLRPLAKTRRSKTRTLPYACGKTKVFFKAGAQDMLEELRSGLLGKKAVIIQSWARKNIELSALAEKKRKICKLQAWGRMVLAFSAFKDKKQRVLQLQAWVRMLAAVSLFSVQRQSSVTIQAWTRKCNEMQTFADKKAKACIIQAQARRVAAVSACALKRKSILIIQAWNRKLAAVSAFDGLKKKVCTIQSLARMSAVRTRIAIEKEAATLIATWIRRYWSVGLLKTLKREKKIQIFRSAVVIQSALRSWSARRRYENAIAAVVVIQFIFRAWSARRQYENTVAAAVVIQKASRNYVSRMKAREEILVSKREQGKSMEVRHVVAEAKTTEKKLKKELLTLRAEHIKQEGLWSVEAEKLRAEIDRLQSQNTKLTDKLNSSEALNKAEAQNSRLQTVEAERLRSQVDALKAQSERLEATLKSEKDVKVERSQVEDDLRSVQSEKRKAEMEILRAQNTKLELKIKSLYAEKNEALSSGSAASSSKPEKETDQCLKELMETNADLMKEAFKYRSELKKQKHHHKSQSIQMKSKLSLAEEELERVMKLHEKEVKDLAEALRDNEKKIDDERQDFARAMNAMKEKHGRDIKKLTKELQKTHRSHQEYLSELMDTLETAHAMRVQETERISNELETVKEKKDKQIRVLKEEVRLLCTRKIGLQNVKGVIDLTSMKEDLLTEADDRARRSAQFDDTVQALSSLVMATEAESPSSNAEDSKKKKKAKKSGSGSSSSKQQQEQEKAASSNNKTQQKMSEMIDTLNMIYKMEEDVQATRYQTAIDIMEEYMAVTEPTQTIVELRERLADEEFTCSKLREELKDKAVCKKCEVRKEAARRRIERSGIIDCTQQNEQ